MLRNFLKAALRNSLRNKGYTFINMFGLAVGLSVFLLLLFYIRHEQGFNMYNSKAERTYRVVEYLGASGEASESKTVFTNWALGGALKENFPEVEEMTRVFIMGSSLHTIGEKRFLERNYYVIEKTFFDVFDHTFLSGNLDQEIGNSSADLVLTKSTALKYFGDQDPINQIVQTDRMGSCRVVAVVDDLPLNSSFRPDFYYLTDINRWSENTRRYYASWENRNCGIFLVLNENASPETILAGREPLLKANLGDQWKMREFELQAMADFHLRSVDIATPTQSTKGNQQYMIIFGLIAAFVLVIAMINYINLATARAIFRRREVGIRKVVGASRKQLMLQFLLESLLMSAIALLISLCIVELALPWLNAITERSIDIPYLQKPQILLFLLAVSFGTGFVSGIVPAFIISSYQPGDVLQGHAFQKVGKLITRKILVVFQFSLSIIMIIATLVVYQQMQYVQNRDMGFEKERKLIVDINSGNVRSNFKAIKSEFLSHPDVLSVASVSRVPGEWKTLPSVEVTKLAGDPPLNMNYMAFDSDGIPTLGISLMAGENFSGNDQLDSLRVIINEKAASLLGGEQVIGQRINIGSEGQTASFVVTGIVEDFNFESLYQEVGPMVIGSWNSGLSYIDYFVLNTRGDPSSVVAHAGNVHHKFAPDGIIEYNFLDQQWERYYQDDVKRGIVFAFSAGLAIFIACLGLFGLASFATSLRIKEFGIRKVLGASSRHLMVLITREFLILVLIGLAMASPVAYWLMKKWLSSFAYNGGISVNIFLVTALSVVTVALVTVGYKSLKAARQNPVDALRN